MIDVKRKVNDCELVYLKYLFSISKHVEKKVNVIIKKNQKSKTRFVNFFNCVNWIFNISLNLFLISHCLKNLVFYV